jgi:hypothetical protein
MLCGGEIGAQDPQWRTCLPCTARSVALEPRSARWRAPIPAPRRYARRNAAVLVGENSEDKNISDQWIRPVEIKWNDVSCPTVKALVTATYTKVCAVRVEN